MFELIQLLIGISIKRYFPANGTAGFAVQTAVDWYNSQTLDLDNASIFWKSLAPKPTSSVYASDRAGEGDGIHVAVVDDLGVVTGIKGNVLEKHLSLSKAVDAVTLDKKLKGLKANVRIYDTYFLSTQVLGIDVDAGSRLGRSQRSKSIWTKGQSTR